MANFKVKYLGHTKYDENGNLIAIQSLKDHLINTKDLAERYGKDLSISHMTGLTALVHDLGKYRDGFQTYIRENNKNKRGSVDHSSFGGMFIREYINDYVSDLSSSSEIKIAKQFGEIIENSIFSHHNTLGLKDFLNYELTSPFLTRIENFNNDKENQTELNNAVSLFYQEVMSKEAFDKYVSKAINEYKEITKILNKSGKIDDFYKMQSFLTTFIYSCLLDADRTDTASFEIDGNQSNARVFKNDNHSLFSNYYKRLVSEINEMNAHSTGAINKLRAKISEECDQAAEKESNIYTLSAPTGSGKTLASMRYALKHSILKHKSHIIYVLPYITIIEQNANVIREKLNGTAEDTKNILEFHSNVSNDLKPTENERENTLDLAEDSWDSPIIFTTMVQFLNVVYASRTTNRHRFHNLCNSVIIFDEVQKVPTKCLAMFAQVINFLRQVGKSDIVLCTATQPALDKIDQEIKLTSDSEIIKNLNKKTDQFKRVELIDKTKDNNGQDLVLNGSQIAKMIFDKAKSVKSILGIFNTIKATQNIYQELQQLTTANSMDTQLYYLSTEMCPLHRQNTIKEMLDKVANNKPVICISTPLIEAGVDASFEVVYRSATGVDSIIQAAGRCNRNGNDKKIGQVYIVNDSDENLSSLIDIEEGKRITINNLLSKFDAGQLMEPKIIREYFSQFYDNNPKRRNYPYPEKNPKFYLDGFVDGLSQVKNFYSQKHKLPEDTQLFSGSETIARHFEVISNEQVSVLAPYDGDSDIKGSKIIASLNGKIDSLNKLIGLLKKAQPFIVNLYEEKFKNLFENGDIYQLNPNNIGNKQLFAFKPEFYEQVTDSKQVSLEAAIF